MEYGLFLAVTKIKNVLTTEHKFDIILLAFSLINFII